MTTIAASIEKMKEALNKIHTEGTEQKHLRLWSAAIAYEALDSLPEPSTEDDIHALVYPKLMHCIDKEELLEVIRALKEAGCLYVKEGK